MSEPSTPQPPSNALRLERILNATPEQVFNAWTKPELMVQWFCPKPWYISDVNTDVRPGGASRMTMNGPAGEKFPNQGVYLEVVPHRKLVFTDAFTDAWTPSAKPFFVCTLTFEPLGPNQTRYTAIAQHWTEQDKASHEAMGFHEGWGIATDQMQAMIAAQNA